MIKNVTDFVSKTILTKQSGVRVRRSLLSLILSVMLIMSNATSFVQVASAASGDFSIDFTAAAPQSYNHQTGGGAFDDGTIGVGKDVVKSLEGGDFSCGDIVTFFAVVKVDGTSGKQLHDDPQTIEMNFSFTADTTGQSGAAFVDIVGVRVNNGTVEDLIPGENTIDDGITGDAGSVATLTSETLTGPIYQKGSKLLGTVELTDLEAGEQVVVRIDVKLSCNPGSNPTGNLQAAIEDARLTSINGNIPAKGNIRVGRQTIPLKKINDLRTAKLEIQKTVNTTDGTCPGVEMLTVIAGNTVKYCYIVSNPGNAPLYNVNVIDDAGTPSNKADDFTVTLSSGLTDVDGDGNADDLAAGGTATGVAMVTLSSAGTIVNNATATGKDSIIEPRTLIDSDIATVIVEGIPSYTIDKTVIGADKDGDGKINNAGEVIEYQITVNNTGSIDLTNVTVTDSLIPAANITGPTGDNPVTGILEVGESWIFTGSYTVTQKDINTNGDGDGFINNTATVDCNELDQLSDSEEVPVIKNAAYTIEKVITDVAGKGPLGDVTKAGDVISYQITVTNAGNMDLTNVTVADPLLITLNGPVESLSADGTLEAGETWIYSGSYTVTQADISNNGEGDGDIDNTATVNCDQLEPKSDSAAVPIIPVCEPRPAYEIEKCITDVDCRGPDASVTGAGDVITYRITVTNTGDINLTNVTVTDSLIALAGPMESKNKNGILEIGETWTYTGKYTVTQKDIDTDGGCDGYIDNTATADCDQLDPKSDSARAQIEKIPVPESCPAYKIEKCVTDVDCRGPKANVTQSGDIITYRITVTNTGNIGLTNVVVNDPLIKTLKGPVESKNVNKILDAGEKWTYTGSYTVTQEDIGTDGGCDGYIDNTATVDCDQLNPKSDSARVLIEKGSAEEDRIEEIPIEEKKEYCIYKSIIGVDKAGDCIINKPGDIIEYQIIVKNEGNTNLTGVSVSDPMITLVGPAGDETDRGVLNPGETWKFVGNYTVTQEDIISNGGGDGFIDNTATVRCNELPDESSSVRQPVVLPSNEVDNENDDDAGSDEDNGNNGGSGGGTGSARIISKSSTNNKINENKEKETGIELEPEIKGIEQETGNAEENAEKIPEQEENTVIPGFLIYGIIGLLAILLFALLRRRK